MSVARVLFLFLSGLAALSSGCGARHKDSTAQSVPPPADESTPDQRTQITAALAKIENVTADLGHPQSFRSVPVLVTSGTQFISDAKGACVRIGNRPQFILLRPAVLDFEAHLPPDSKVTSLFAVLLHEIGHCYFNREHDAAQIQTSGFQIAMKETQDPNSLDEKWNSLDATVMNPNKVLMANSLDHYYVAEVMGFVNKRTLDAVAAYADPKMSISFVKIEQPAPEPGARPVPTPE